MQQKIIFKLIMLTLMIVGLVGFCMAHEGHEEIPRVLLISFDGFRWDYLDIVRRYNIKTPNFDRMIEEGVTVAGPGVTNTFVTKTLPNHYTLVTGLYQESHGVVANDFYDPWFNQTFNTKSSEIATDIKWWNGTGSQKVEPIWVTNEAAGYGRASGICMWWGSDVIGQTPSFYTRNNKTVPFERRADDVISWFTNKTKRINFGAVYMNEPDHTGHYSGPESQALAEKIGELDTGLEYLLNGLQKHNLLHGMNIIITSDHGMEPLKSNIYLDEFVNSSMFMSYGGSPIRHVVPISGYEDIVFSQLSKIENATVKKKEELSEDLHYKYNRRIAPLMIVADPGFQLCDNQKCGGKTKNLKGDHGWDTKMPSMHPIFIARGPAFKKKYVASPFESVNVYSLLCHLLDISPRPNNGSLDNIKHILSDGDNLDITMMSYASVLLADGDKLFGYAEETIYVTDTSSLQTDIHVVLAGDANVIEISKSLLQEAQGINFSDCTDLGWPIDKILDEFVLLFVGFAALVSGIWCIGACRAQRYSRHTRADSRWKPLRLGTMSKTENSKPLLEDNEEEEDLA